MGPWLVWPKEPSSITIILQKCRFQFLDFKGIEKRAEQASDSNAASANNTFFKLFCHCICCHSFFKNP